MRSKYRKATISPPSSFRQGSFRHTDPAIWLFQDPPAKRSFLAITALAFACSVLPSEAVVSVLAQYDFEDGDGGSYLAPRMTHQNITATNMLFQTDDAPFQQDSAGDTRTDVTFDDSDSGAVGNKWNSIKATNPNSSNGEDFLSFTLSPNPGITINLDCVNFMVAKSNNNGIGYMMRTRKDGIESLLGIAAGDITLVSTVDNAWEWIMVDMGSIQELQGITRPITFEIVITNASNNVDLRFDKIEVTGTAVPEPSIAFLVAIAALGGVFYRSRSRSAIRSVPAS